MSTDFTPAAAAACTGPEWLVDRRRAAAEQFARAEMPTTEQEVWRYSRIGDLDLAQFRPATDAPTPRFTVPDGAVDLVVRTVDAVLVDTIGDVSLLGDDAGPGRLGAAIGEGHDALGMLHDAFATPIRITVAPGVAAGTVLVVHEAQTDGVAGFPRLVVEVGQGASLTVVEVFSSDDGLRTLTVPVTELLIDRDATLRYSSAQLLGEDSWMVGNLSAVVGQNGTLRSGTAAFGGDYSRLRIDTSLAGRGATGDISAAYFGDRAQLLDFRTFQDHVAPDTTSNLLFKGALGASAASVYTGLIKIRPDARGANAFQTNRNLKLSDEAWAESVPNLEIENNEVHCSHASTVSPIDPEQRFYLESRGVPTDRAERLIVRGFFADVLADLELGPVADLVDAAIDRKLEATFT